MTGEINILVGEDEKKIADRLRYGLNENGFEGFRKQNLKIFFNPFTEQELILMLSVLDWAYHWHIASLSCIKVPFK
jgi:hypothetical protein